MSNVVIGGTATGATALPVANSIDATNDLLAIYTASATATQAISRNTLLNLTSQPLGLTDTQSPTNKTFNNTNTYTSKDANLVIQNSADTTKQAKFSAASITTGTTRTYTLPDASDTLVALAATQTLTNKTLTSPTITGGTYDNGTITVDSISGHTVATTVTVANLQIANGVLNTNNSVQTSNLQANAVTTAKLATSAVTTPILKPSVINFSASVAGSDFTTSSAGYVDITGVSTTYTTGSSNERLFIWLSAMISTAAAANALVTLSIASAGSSAQSPALYVNGSVIQRQSQLYIFDAAASTTYTIKAQGKTSTSTLTVSMTDANYVPTIRGFAISNV